MLSEHGSTPNQTSVRAWVVTIVAGLFFFYSFIQWSMFNALTPGLMKHFSVTDSDVARLSALYFYANVFCLFPAGIILDRLSTRRVILLAITAMVCATLGFAFVRAFWQAELLRLAVGVSGAFCLLSSVRLASRWFAANRLALVIGVIVMLAMTGGMIAQTPFTWIADHYGWQSTVIVDTVIGIVIAAAIFFVVEDAPRSPVSGPHQSASIKQYSFWAAIRLTVRNRQNWLAGLYTSFMNLPILIFMMWGSLYLVQDWHMSRVRASWIDMALLLGAIIGSPVLGGISDWLGRRRLPMIVSAVIALGLSSILLYASHLSYVQLMVLFLFIGFFTSAQVIGYPLIAESNPPALTATAEGLGSVLIMAGGVIQQVFGYLLNYFGQHTVIAQVSHYSLASYHAALFILPIAFLAACLMAFLAEDRLLDAVSDNAEQYQCSLKKS